MTRPLSLPPGAHLVPVYNAQGKEIGKRIEYDTSGGGGDSDPRIPHANGEQFAERQEAVDKGQRGNGPLAQLAPSDSPARTAGAIPARRSPNKTEIRYAIEVLDAKWSHEDVTDGYEAIKLRLDRGTWYLPDFFLWNGADSPEIHEVKAPHRFAEKGKMKWKWAKQKYGHLFRFVFAMRVKGGWEIEE